MLISCFRILSRGRDCERVGSGWIVVVASFELFSTPLSSWLMDVEDEKVKIMKEKMIRCDDVFDSQLGFLCVEKV